MSENEIKGLIAELRKGDGNGCKHSNSVMNRAADALEAVHFDSLVAQTQHARWQERAEGAEHGLFRVVQALGFDMDGTRTAGEFFGPMTYCTEDEWFTEPADIAVAFAADYRREAEEEADKYEVQIRRLKEAR